MHLSTDINPLFQQALQYHQQGHLAQAEQGYQQILNLQPQHADTLHLYGVLKYQQGQFSPAIALIRQALTIAPNTAHFHSNLANALKDDGQTGSAIAHYRLALKLEPRLAEVHNNLGTVLQDSGQSEDAIKSYRKAIAYQPHYAEAYFNLGMAFKQIVQPEAAIKNWLKALELAPQYVDAAWQVAQLQLSQGHWNDAVRGLKQILEIAPHHRPALKALGRIYIEQHQWPEALPLYQRLAALPPAEAEVLYHLGQTWLQLSQAHEATAAFEHALALEPHNALIYDSLGNSYAQQGLIQQAKQAYREATRLQPEWVYAWRSLAHLYEQADDFAAAAPCLEQALALDRQDANTWFNWAVVLQKTGHYAEAEAACQQALKLDPELILAQYNLGFCQLIQGDYRAGFASYESRWQMVDNDLRMQMLNQRWQGQALPNQTLWLQSEQGLGDTIQFARYLPWIRAQVGDDARIIFTVSADLIELLTPLAASCQIQLSLQPAESFDVQIPLLSVPGLAGTTWQTVPWSGPYLHPAPAWELPPAIKSAPRLKIGLAWTGNPANQLNKYRSCSLADLQLLIQHPQIQCYALQKELTTVEQTQLQTWKGIDLSEKLTSFQATAHYLAALDGIVSIDTSLIHLAGALGHRAWLLLSAYHDWRWLADGHASPWYPEVQILRQTTLFEWDAVIQACIRHLQDLSA